MFVIMALVTTLMTGPLLSFVDWWLPEKVKEQEEQRQAETRKFKVLVPFGDPERGRNMVRVANAFVRENENAAITALHLSPSSELNTYNMADRERDSFGPIRKEAVKEGMRMDTIFKPSNDIDKDVVATANSGLYDMAIVGVGRSIYHGTLLGRVVGITSRIIDPERLLDTITGKESLFERTDFEDRIRQILRGSRIPVGIYVEKDLERLDRIVVPIFGAGDAFLLTWVQKLLHNSNAHVALVDLGDVFLQSPEMLTTVHAMEASKQLTIHTVPEDPTAFLSDQDLMLISLESWKRAVEKRAPWLPQVPSTLIMRP
jgi:hypothetical protein